MAGYAAVFCCSYCVFRAVCYPAGDQNYPGGAPFDPLGFSSKPDEFVDQAVKEVKNGRLAMLAMAGYFAQAAVTRQGPLQNLIDFAADPVHNNVFGYITGNAVSR